MTSRAIREFIAEQSPALATPFIERIVRRAEQLAKFPLSGSMVGGDLPANVRQLLIGSYRIVYRVTESKVEILTIYHAARMWNKDAIDEP